MTFVLLLVKEKRVPDRGSVPNHPHEGLLCSLEVATEKDSFVEMLFLDNSTLILKPYGNIYDIGFIFVDGEISGRLWDWWPHRIATNCNKLRFLVPIKELSNHSQFISYIGISLLWIWCQNYTQSIPPLHISAAVRVFSPSYFSSYWRDYPTLLIMFVLKS